MTITSYLAPMVSSLSTSIMVMSTASTLRQPSICEVEPEPNAAGAALGGQGRAQCSNHSAAVCAQVMNGFITTVITDQHMALTSMSACMPSVNASGGKGPSQYRHVS